MAILWVENGQNYVSTNLPSYAWPMKVKKKLSKAIQIYLVILLEHSLIRNDLTISGHRRGTSGSWQDEPLYRRELALRTRRMRIWITDSQRQRSFVSPFNSCKYDVWGVRWCPSWNVSSAGPPSLQCAVSCKWHDELLDYTSWFLTLCCFIRGVLIDNPFILAAKLSVLGPGRDLSLSGLSLCGSCGPSVTERGHFIYLASAPDITATSLSLSHCT